MCVALCDALVALPRLRRLELCVGPGAWLTVDGRQWCRAVLRRMCRPAQPESKRAGAGWSPRTVRWCLGDGAAGVVACVSSPEALPGLVERFPAVRSVTVVATAGNTAGPVRALCGCADLEELRIVGEWGTDADIAAVVADAVGLRVIDASAAGLSTLRALPPTVQEAHLGNIGPTSEVHVVAAGVQRLVRLRCLSLAHGSEEWAAAVRNALASSGRPVLIR